MQTIRIYSTLTRGWVHQVTGIAGKVETEKLRRQYPEENGYLWLR